MLATQPGCGGYQRVRDRPVHRPIVIKIRAAFERAFPEQRLFLRSDTETRFIRLSPLTQFVGVTGSALVL
jgi:hypothetical protein